MEGFFKDFIYLFLERGEGREKERERNINMWLPLTRPLLGTWLAAQACVLPGNGTGNPLVPRPVLNPLRYSSQRRVMEYFISHVFAKAPCPTRPHTVCAPFIRTPRKTSLLTNIRKSSDLFKSFCLFLSYGHRESRTE